MALNLAYVYTTDADVRRLLSESGALEMADDDDDGAEEAGVFQDAIWEATEDVNARALERYAAADLADSVWVNRKATVLAACVLAGRRGNPVPESLLRRCEKVGKELEQLKDGLLDVPGLSEREASVPSMSNLVHTHRRRISKVRVEKTTSTGGATTTDQDVDRTDFGDFE